MKMLIHYWYLATVQIGHIYHENDRMLLLPSFLTSPLDLVNSANIVKAQMSGSPHRVPWDRQPY